MRRWFLILLTLLVAAQLSWAGAELCCVEELGGSGSASLVVSEQAHAAKASDTHLVCETGHCHCHHAGSATPLAEREAREIPQALALEPAAALRLESHIPAGLERPNWLGA